MDLIKSVVQKEGMDDTVAFVDPKTLTKEEKGLVKDIEKGNEAEAKLTSSLLKAMEGTEYTSAEIDINADKGSYLRVATINGAIVEDGEEQGMTVVTESVNGYMTELMQEINAELKSKMAEPIELAESTEA